MMVQKVSLRARAVAGVVAAAVVGALLVAGVRATAEGPAATVAPGVSPVLGFAADSAVPDPERRAGAIRQWVLPARALEFVAAYDDYGVQVGQQWSDVVVTPVSYQVVGAGGDEARVVLFSEVRRTPREGSGVSTVWELSGYGVIWHSDRWWVYAYFGKQQVAGAEDPLVRDFTPVPATSA